ncbi:uncharacterized protein PAC_16563 [Phialocephala subalpina]|uniref:Uncharacterized protein n=1 Tax=Phialocephala subalpina TaxID=576137 RepID=A0A1L7XNQ8_9HELO|nr:uncharacterized protein PAC_16563 [Phialocephala subalpina]
MPDFTCEQYRDFVAHVGRRAHAQSKLSTVRPITLKLVINPGITTTVKHRNKIDRSQYTPPTYEKRRCLLEKIVSRMLQDALLLGVDEGPDEFEINPKGKFPFHLAKLNCPWIYDFMELSECPEQSAAQFQKIENFLENTSATTAPIIDLEEDDRPALDDPSIRLWTSIPQVCDEYLDFIHAVVYLSSAARGYECIISEKIFGNRFDEARRENNRCSKTIRGILRLMCMDSILRPIKGADGCFILHPDCPTQDYMSKRKGGFEQQHHWIWGACRSRDLGIRMRTLESFLRVRGVADRKVSAQLNTECFAFESATDLRLITDHYDKEDSELKERIVQSEKRNQLPEWCIAQLATVRQNNPDYRFHVSITTRPNCFKDKIHFNFTCHDCGLREEGPKIELASPDHLWWKNSVVAHADERDHLLAKVSKLIKACKSIPKNSSLRRRLETLDESITGGTDASKWEPALDCPKWATLFAWKARSAVMLEDPQDSPKPAQEVADGPTNKLVVKSLLSKRSSDGLFPNHELDSGTGPKRPRLTIDLDVHSPSSGPGGSSGGFKALLVEVVSSKLDEVIQRLQKLEEANPERHSALQKEDPQALTDSHVTTSTDIGGDSKPDRGKAFSHEDAELNLVDVHSRLEALECQTEEQSNCLEGARTFCTDVGDEILTLSEQSIGQEQRIVELESQLESQRQTVETLVRQNEMMMKRMQTLEGINEKLASYITKSGERGCR